VNAFGTNAGYSNTGNNCTFIGTNPNIAVINTLSDRLIVYSSDANNPILYGDTSNMSLGIGTSNLLSAALTVSGKISATGILDTAGSNGTSNQVLTAGAGGGLVWANNYQYIWEFIVNSGAVSGGNTFPFDHIWSYKNNNINMQTAPETFQTIAITGFYQISFRPFIAPQTSNWQLTIQSNGNDWTYGSYGSNLNPSTIIACGYLTSNVSIGVKYSVGTTNINAEGFITYILLSPLPTV
jgi:hypothetical protein